MELLGDIGAGTAQDLRPQMFERLVNPLAARGAHSLIACRTPRIRTRIAGIMNRPEKADPLAVSEAIDDVLADERFLLFAMNLAPTRLTCSSSINRDRQLQRTDAPVDLKSNSLERVGLSTSRSSSTLQLELARLSLR